MGAGDAGELLVVLDHHQPCACHSLPRLPHFPLRLASATSVVDLHVVPAQTCTSSASEELTLIDLVRTKILRSKVLDKCFSIDEKLKNQ